jgi:hypothetical protein
VDRSACSAVSRRWRSSRWTRAGSRRLSGCGGAGRARAPGWPDRARPGDRLRRAAPGRYATGAGIRTACDPRTRFESPVALEPHGGVTVKELWMSLAASSPLLSSPLLSSPLLCTLVCHSRTTSASSRSRSAATPHSRLPARRPVDPARHGSGLLAGSMPQHRCGLNPANLQPRLGRHEPARYAPVCVLDCPAHRRSLTPCERKGGERDSSLQATRTNRPPRARPSRSPHDRPDRFGRRWRE